MRMFTATVALTLGLAVFGTSPARAQSAHVADGAALDRLVTEHAAREDADRQLIRDVLHRPEVRQVAHQSGIDIDRVDAAVSTLSGAELQDVARRARDVNERLSGGSTIVITTTTVIIVLLIIILIIVAAD
jgi:hypothetical protein